MAALALGAHGLAPAATPATNDPVVLPRTVVTDHAPPLPQPETVALTTLGGEAFQRGATFDTRELTTLAPSLATFDGNNNRAPRFSLRGFRELNFTIGEPTVPMYIDDVAITELASRGMPLYDLDRVDVLRGPQGTTMGATSPGGVINLHTRQPANLWEGHGGVGYGNYNSLSAEAAVRGAVVPDHLFLGVSGLLASRDGFVHNTLSDTWPDTQDTLSGRVQLRWKPADEWDVSLFASADRFRDGMTATYYPGLDTDWFEVQRNLDGYANTESQGLALRIVRDTPGLRIMSATGYRHWRQDLLQDFDFSPADFLQGFSRPDITQWSQELRLQSADDARPVRWLAGGYVSGRRKDNDFGSTVVPANASQEILARSGSQTYAVFGQVTWSVLDTLDLVAGLRLTLDDRDIDRRLLVDGGPVEAASYQADAQFTDVQPKAGVAWHPTPEVEGYFTFTTGYQSGGFNASSDEVGGSGFDPVRSQNYELGLKSAWWERRLEANVALYLTEARDYQVYYINPDNPTETHVLNAEASTLLGAEAELRLRPAEALEIQGSFSCSRARFDRYTSPVTGQNFDGNTISFVPAFTVDASAAYRFPFGLRLGVELQAVGDFYFTEDNTQRQDAYLLLNAVLAYERPHWSLRVFGRNLTDARYASNALELGPGSVVLQPGNPLTYGFAAEVRF